jgi:hypothetical protein
MLDNHRGKRQDKLPDMDLCHAETRVPSSSSCRCVIFPRATYPTCRELGVCIAARGDREWARVDRCDAISSLFYAEPLSQSLDDVDVGGIGAGLGLSILFHTTSHDTS